MIKYDGIAAPTLSAPLFHTLQKCYRASYENLGSSPPQSFLALLSAIRFKTRKTQYGSVRDDVSWPFRTCYQLYNYDPCRISAWNNFWLPAISSNEKIQIIWTKQDRESKKCWSWMDGTRGHESLACSQSSKLFFGFFIACHRPDRWQD